MDLGLTGKVVIVSWGGQGICGAISQSLAAEGAVPVIFAFRVPDATFLAPLTAVCPAKGWEQANLSSDADCRNAVAQTRTRWGRIDALVNNAGTTDGIRLEPEAFRASLDQNIAH